MEIIVHDDIEDALRRLKAALRRDGILVQLKMRGMYPNLTDRAKAKAIRALIRRRKKEGRTIAAMRMRRG